MPFSRLLLRCGKICVHMFHTSWYFLSSIFLLIFYYFYRQKRNSQGAFFLAICQRIMQYCPVVLLAFSNFSG